MDFFDCNTSYGIPLNCNDLYPVHTIDVLKKEIERAGVKKAVVGRIEHWLSSTLTANDMLATDIKNLDNFYGLWSIVPSHTHELPDPAAMPTVMRQNRIIGWRLCPEIARFMVRTFVLRDWLDIATRYKIPIFINTSHGTSLDELADIMKDYPELTVVLTYSNCWPSDRLLRPFIAEYSNIYLDMSYWFIDGGIEDFVKEYGSGRLLYGSGFPYSYFGSNMLMIRHAELSEKDKEAIASGNMERIVREVNYD